MIPLQIHHHTPPYFPIPQTTPRLLSPKTLHLPPHKPNLLLAFTKPTSHLSRASQTRSLFFGNHEDNTGISSSLDDMSPNGVVYKKTLALVECSMFAALTGLVYFLSNSLGIENYFGCFFSLPIVITSMRWGVAAGRKTMVATTMLLLVLSGPLKALTYLLKHGIVGFTMGSMWRSGANWTASVLLCATVRALGSVCYVLITSFLIRENLFALITINIHASLTFIFTAAGIYTVPSMESIYALFSILVFINNASFTFLLHLLYAAFLSRLGMKASLRLPGWLEKAI